MVIASFLSSYLLVPYLLEYQPCTNLVAYILWYLNDLLKYVKLVSLEQFRHFWGFMQVGLLIQNYLFLKTLLISFPFQDRLVHTFYLFVQNVKLVLLQEDPSILFLVVYEERYFLWALDVLPFLQRSFFFINHFRQVL